MNRACALARPEAAPCANKKGSRALQWPAGVILNGWHGTSHRWSALYESAVERVPVSGSAMAPVINFTVCGSARPIVCGCNPCSYRHSVRLVCSVLKCYEGHCTSCNEGKLL